MEMARQPADALRHKPDLFRAMNAPAEELLDAIPDGDPIALFLEWLTEATRTELKDTKPTTAQTSKAMRRASGFLAEPRSTWAAKG